VFEFEFMQRAFVAGLLVAFTCPVIGIFLVARRQSLIGDGLGHIAFAGVCAGWLLRWQPVFSAALFTVLGACVLEKVRSLRSEFSDLILAIFFYCGMALAAVLSGMDKSGGLNLASFLFGSIVTVSAADLYTAAGIGLITLSAVALFYRQLVCAAFDEETARVSGLPIERLNFLLSVLTALSIAVSMRIVGLLLVSAMMVMPAAAALPWKKGFAGTLFISVGAALLAVIVGLTLSFYGNLAPGGAIVLTAGALFVLSELLAYAARRAAR
jgi:zinc transport system permease protein